MQRKSRMVYILAPSYSGSTLLTYLLAQHPAIATVGELKATSRGDLSTYRCSCGSLMRECSFWLELEQRAQSAGLQFSIDEFGTVYGEGSKFPDRVVNALVRGKGFEVLRKLLLTLLPESQTRIKAVTHQNHTLSQIILEMQNGEIFLDGSKDSSRLLHYLNAGIWDIRVIYLQRDGRGVSNSYVKHDGVSYDGAIAYWKRAITELQVMRNRLNDDQVYDLLYEDLCRKPERILGEICDWLSISPLSSSHSFDIESQHILGNSMRLNNVSEVRFDESWRTALTDKQLSTFEQHAGSLNRSLGYVNP